MDNLFVVIGVFSFLFIGFIFIFMVLPKIYISRGSRKLLDKQEGSYILKPSKLNMITSPIIMFVGFFLLLISIKAIFNSISNIFAIQGLLLISILMIWIGINIIRRYLTEALVITDDFIKKIDIDNEITTIYWQELNKVTFSHGHILVLSSESEKIEVRESYEGFVMLVKALQSNVDQSIYLEALQTINTNGKYLKGITNLIEN